MSASFADGAARYDMLDTVREYVLERLAESGGLAAARGAHAEYFAALAEEARTGCAGRNGCAGNGAWSWRTTTSGLRSAYARDAPDPPSRSGSGGWAGTSRSPSASPRDGASSSSPWPRRGDDASPRSRIELLADLCYLATEELDLEAALAAGERGARARRDARRTVARHGRS